MPEAKPRSFPCSQDDGTTVMNLNSFQLFSLRIVIFFEVMLSLHIVGAALAKNRQDNFKNLQATGVILQVVRNLHLF